jgi:hypothetical protein
MKEGAGELTRTASSRLEADGSSGRTARRAARRRFGGLVVREQEVIEVRRSAVRLEVDSRVGVVVDDERVAV